MYFPFKQRAVHYKTRMKIVGLTGSIAMGKSVAAAEFRRCLVPVFDADAEIHHLLLSHCTVISRIKNIVPMSYQQGYINRAILADTVLRNTKILLALEKVLYPFLLERQIQFLKMHQRRNTSLVVLDIPLLFEKGWQIWCDYVAVVSAPSFIQKRRALGRPDMTEKKYNTFVQLQLADIKKRKQADYVIYSGLSKATSRRHVRTIIAKLRGV